MKTPNIVTGVKKEPFLGILHGPHGIGKTCFGMKMPNAIYITGEETGEYDITRFDKCESWEDFMSCLNYLRDSQHDYKSLVIDTLDSIESLLFKKILKDDPKHPSSMAVACGGYGKAFEKAMNMMYDVRDNYLSKLRAKGMHILILAHSSKNKVEDPLTQSSYDRYELKLHKNSKGVGVYTVFSEWVSVILFSNFEVYKTEDEKYAVGEGRRLLFTEPRPAFDAKNRFGFPYQMNLDWVEVATALKAYYEGKATTPKPAETETQKVAEQAAAIEPEPEPVQENAGANTVRANIQELLQRLSDSNLVQKVEKAVEKAGDDLNELDRIQGKLLKAVS